MMTQYLKTKEEYPGCILFYRLGDFYEMFFEDAKLVSKELELTLTGKDCGLEERAPMCGVPHHAAEVYLNKLVQKGYKVAIAEQVEDPKLAKGLVKREVVKIVTPGTITNANALVADRNNYLFCAVYLSGNFGIASVDISTGDFYTSEADTVQELYDEINKYTPSELICNPDFQLSGINPEKLKEQYQMTISILDNRFFSDISARSILKDHFHVAGIESLGLLDMQKGMIAAGAALRYLYDTQKSGCSQISSIHPYSCSEYLLIDSNSKRNLELLETIREKKKQGSLLWVLDKTKTAMGARLLRNYIEQPLIEVSGILQRQEAITEFIDRYIDMEELREYLDFVYDLERLMGRVNSKQANTADLLALASSLKILHPVKDLLGSFKSELLYKLSSSIDCLEDVHALITDAISEEASSSLKEGNIIKEGYNPEVDKLRKASREGKLWLGEFEAKERKKTGIKNLKIKYNKVFGYYLEVTNSFKHMVPDYFIRKQTLANAERYTMPELKELEDMILGAEDKLCSLEYEIFVGIREDIAKEVKRIQNSAKAVAALDVLLSLSIVSYRNKYTCPKINKDGIIDIKEGRHPVVEKMMSDHMFISNDTYLDNAENRMSIITGPNMAGKSTYMRQNALIVLMAQIGCFIPASFANISVCDRIFTRVGASDDLSGGQSTFMVEMTEVANILRNASRDSLIILDEIGRGTSTFDGLSIAWAVVEYISDIEKLGAKTLFATHYHELTELEGSIKGVNNYCILVKESGDEIAFLRKIARGGADKSYGIQVAKLAGVPETVIRRAKVLAWELSCADIANRAKEIVSSDMEHPPTFIKENPKNLSPLFNQNRQEDEIIKEMKNLELASMTPIDALNLLYKLQNKIKNRG